MSKCFFFHFSITQSVFLKTDYIKLLYDHNLKKKRNNVATMQMLSLLLPQFAKFQTQ